MTKEIDKIFEEILDEYYDKVHDVSAIVMEAKNILAQYDLIKTLVSQICSTSSPDDNKVLELRENFYRLVKHINSINQELYGIIFETNIIKDQNQNIE